MSEQTEKRKRGRPPRRPKPGAAETVRKLAAKGVRAKDIALALDIAPMTFEKWREEYPAIGKAYDAGRQVMHDKLVGALFKSAMQGNFVPAIFLLKSTFGYRDSEAPVDGSKPPVTLVLPAPVRSDEYRAPELPRAKTVTTVEHEP